MSVAESNTKTVQDLYDVGAYRRAYDAALACDLFADDGPEALVLRSRLSANLGAPRKSVALGLRALRKYPDHPQVRYFGTQALLRSRGPWEAWKKWHELEAICSPDDPMRSDWLASKGTLAAMLRDFETADRMLDEAERADPTNSWLFVERSEVLIIEDRHEEALAAARTALKHRPDFRPAVQALADLLNTQNLADEAIELLTDVAVRLESGSILHQLAGLLCDARRFDEARDVLDKIPPLWPLIEKSHEQALAAFHSRCAYHRGDEAAAIEFAKQAKTKYNDQVAEHLAAATPEDRRVLLEVPFVRQHHSTCGPATLSALSGYWNRPADHLEVAEKICYDGTSAQSERDWAESNDYFVREFTVDHEVTKALIDRGVPFTLTTCEPTSAHLQAVVGYDARMRVLLVRDSNYRAYGELMADKGLEYYRPTGPRGMLLVPHDQVSRLDGLELPDAELYDRYYDLSRALDRFDRPAAAAALEQMRAAAPFHRLTLQGRRALAGFDGDAASSRAACEQLVKQYPEADVYLYPLWFALRRHAPRAERQAFLEGILKRRDCDPVFRLHMAEELCDSATTHVEAERLLRRLTRTRGYEPRVYYLLGNLYWTERRFDEAQAVFFVAACLGARDEDYAHAYFAASRRVKRVEPALDFLRARFRRFGTKSAHPARTLFTCLSIVDLMDEAFDVLNEALMLRPDDGSLLLFAADAQARHGRFDEAESLRLRAEGKAHPADFLYRTADLAAMRGDFDLALATWRKLQEREPQSIDAAASIARFVGEADGPEAARKFLVELVERFPHNIELMQLTAEHLRDDDPAEAERLVRRLIELNPVDPWSRRELALDLLGLERHEEALQELETAEALDPTSGSLFCIRGRILETVGRWPEARAAFRRAVELGVDQSIALEGVMRLATSHADRIAALEFIYAQLVGQTTYGDGLLSYGLFARRTLSPERVLADLQAALDARPDLWHAWSAVLRQLVQIDRLDEARDLALRETQRFSLVPGAWLDLAIVCRARGDDTEEIEALEHALDISPGWTEALRNLCQAYERRGEFDKARAFMLKAVRRAPSDGVLHGYLADLHWRADAKEEALAALDRAVMLEPGYEWGWSRLRELGQEAGEPDRAANAARALAARAPNHARSWMTVAETLDGEDARDERLQAVDRALQLHPSLVSAYTLKSRLLVEAGEFDAAEAACRPALYGEELPGLLRLQLAQVLDARGDRAAAVEALEALLHDHPDLWSGWNRLADWYEADPAQSKGHLRAAEALVRIAPLDAYGWRHLAEARVRLEDKTGAKEAYRRALEAEPGYEYCANCLIDFALEADDFTEADLWIAHALERDPTPFALARHVRACAMRDRFEQATPSLERLCRMEVPGNDWPLQAAVELFNVPGGRKLARRVLSAAMGDPEAIPAVFLCWVDLIATTEDWDECEHALDRHRDRKAHWSRGVQQLLTAYGDRKLSERAMKFITNNRDSLYADDEAWGEAVYALYCNEYDAELIDWTGDWRALEKRRPWMMLNLGWAHLMRGNIAEALAAHCDAVALPRESSYAANQLSLGFCKAIHGDWAGAEATLNEVEVARLTKEHEILYGVTRAYVEAHAEIRFKQRVGWWSALLLQRRLARRTKADREALAAPGLALAATRLGRRVPLLLAERTARDLGHKLYAWWIRVVKLRAIR